MRVRHPALDAYTNVATAPSRGEGTAGRATDKGRGRIASPEAATASFSGEARQLARTRAGALREDGVDLEKIAALKAMVERGEFKVDPKRIAEGLLDEMA